MTDEPRRAKILYIITKSNWGGAQRYVHDLATSLPREKFDAAVALGGGSGRSDAGEGELARKLAAANIRTVSIPSFSRDIHVRGDIKTFFELRRTILRERPDVVHLNSSKAGGIGALAARLSGVPRIVFTSHGLAWDEDRSALARALIWLATWVTFILCDTVIVISRDNMERARRLPFCSAKVHLVHNGLPPLTFMERTQARRALAARADVPEESSVPWIGTVAEFTRNKGLSYLIGAAALLKERGDPFQLFIIGTNGDERPRIEEQIRSGRLDDRVHLLGFVPDAYEQLGAFDIFALTSVKEGLPYVLLEAGQAGCAVLGSRIPGITDIIDDDISGVLARPRDSKDIAEKLSCLIRGQDRRSGFGAHLRKKITESFSLERMTRDTVVLYAVS